LGGGANKQTKTVLRLGAGVFYDRIADSLACPSPATTG